MPEAAASTYDDMPYDSHPFAQTHPDRLATVATLFGLNPPRLERCRVLELGCAAGGNLIPMALSLPRATFLGIDLSHRQVADGRATVQALGLKNVSLQHLSILDVGANWGPYDYIICHGVYSWVPPEVQDKILTICRQNLAPGGVAYVSYNTYPGWHLRSMIRRMMLYHASRFHETYLRVQQARALLDFLVESAGEQDTPYAGILKSELELLRSCQDGYLFHEHLEEFNEPLYFYEFIDRVAAKGLQYLGEADVSVMVPGHFSPGVQEVLQRLSPDTIHLEQYMDFLRKRMFRQTLLCHKHFTPSYKLCAEQLTAFHVASPARSLSETPDIRSPAPEQFRGPGGVTMTVRDPLMKAAVVHLSQVWPRAVLFEQLCQAARRLLGAVPVRPETLQEHDAERLGKALLSIYTGASSGLIEFHLHPPQPVVELSPRPCASPLARLQAAQGHPVTTLRHNTCVLPEFDRQLLCLLDGSRDRSALLDALAELAAQDVLVVYEDGEPVTAGQSIRRHLADALEQQLPGLARRALLIG
jgi:methyltransferase-like protein/SAM-dependent methyltransferase